MKNKKSPLKSKPLRHAGQSLDEEIEKRLSEKITLYIYATVMFSSLIIMEWYRWYMQSPPSPVWTTILALPFVLYGIYQLIKEIKQIKLLKQGRDGEKAVGQYLENFREAGIKVHHDIVGDGFNIDHILISTKGIYLIETKTYSKPLKGKTEIEFDGLDFYYNGVKYNDNIQVQVMAGATWLKNLIEELTVKKIDVKPVVVFPGWFVKMTRKHDSNIWALNPRNLQKFINKQNEIISKEDVQLISNHIARYIRAR
ncbi:MAG: NERD domain-containing protein [Flavobacteriaceae bacterium]|nr:NERD domain-containing protein [Flavobacteriaceae bacterium]